MTEAEHHLPYLLHALTPVHVGGDEGQAGIDLPTLREQHTGYPLIPGSSVKGVLREEAMENASTSEKEVNAAFGPPSEEAGDHRGGLVFTDALLLALPVRSLYGTFAWLTCPFALHRLSRDLGVSGLDPLPTFAELVFEDCAVPASDDGKLDSKLVERKDDSGRVYLDEVELTARPSQDAATLARDLSSWLWPGDAEAAELFRGRLAVVHDDLLGFLSRLALEVRSRVKIDRDTGTAAGSGPWTEEHIPAETLLAGLAVGRRTQEGRRPEGTRWKAEQSLEVLRSLTRNGPLLRFGGNATIGLGRTRMRLVENGGVRS